MTFRKLSPSCRPIREIEIRRLGHPLALLTQSLICIGTLLAQQEVPAKFGIQAPASSKTGVWTKIKVYLVGFKGKNYVHTSRLVRIHISTTPQVSMRNEEIHIDPGYSDNDTYIRGDKPGDVSITVSELGSSNALESFTQTLHFLPHINEGVEGASLVKRMGIAHLTIKAVNQGAFTPTARTILTLKNTEGYIIHEVVPDAEGTSKVDVESGKYLLSAVGAGEELKIEVSPPETTITIQISASGVPSLISQSPGRPPDLQPRPAIAGSGVPPLIHQSDAPHTDSRSSLEKHELWIGIRPPSTLADSPYVRFLPCRTISRSEGYPPNPQCVVCRLRGTFITGDALFTMTGQNSVYSYSLSGTAGCALFFVVWFFFPKVPDRFPDGYSMHIPSGRTFQQAVEAIDTRTAGRRRIRGLYQSGTESASAITHVVDEDGVSCDPAAALCYFPAEFHQSL